jgi:hypothetical protein
MLLIQRGYRVLATDRSVTGVKMGESAGAEGTEREGLGGAQVTDNKIKIQ